MSRVIFLVDMNAFFISCEATRRPELWDIPAAVAGDPQRRSGIILTANYKARAFGVRTTMALFEARRLCPDIVLVPPDHKFYSHMSSRVMAILGRYSPSVEQNSIDEAWLDMTGSEMLFGSPLNAAHKIMDEIKSSLNLWCSIGIAQNKFLAKMASDMKKPLGITELWEKDIPTKLWPLPVDAMYGIGSQTAAKLRGLGIRTIGDISAYGNGLLQHSLGKYGEMLLSLAKGIDNSPVAPHEQNSMKSVGRSTTMPQDINDIGQARRVLMTLAEEVGADTRRHGKKGTTVTITIKYDDFSTITRQASISPTCLTRDIFECGAKLLQKNWTRRPVRLLGISLSGFKEDEGQQLSFFVQENNDEKQEHLEKTVDDIRQRFGNDKIKRASLITPKNDENNE